VAQFTLPGGWRAYLVIETIAHRGFIGGTSKNSPSEARKPDPGTQMS
jgi:hypothetical protein